MKHLLILIFSSFFTLNGIHSQSLPSQGIYYFTECDGYEPCKVNFWSVVGTADKETQEIIMTVIPYNKQNRAVLDKVVKNGKFITSTVNSMEIEVEINSRKTVLKFSGYTTAF